MAGQASTLPAPNGFRSDPGKARSSSCSTPGRKPCRTCPLDCLGGRFCLRVKISEKEWNKARSNGMEPSPAQAVFPSNRQSNELFSSTAPSVGCLRLRQRRRISPCSPFPVKKNGRIAQVVPKRTKNRDSHCKESFPQRFPDAGCLRLERRDLV